MTMAAMIIIVIMNNEYKTPVPATTMITNLLIRKKKCVRGIGDHAKLVSSFLKSIKHHPDTAPTQNSYKYIIY